MNGKKVLTIVLSGIFVIGLSVGAGFKLINNNDKSLKEDLDPPVEIKPIETTTPSEKLNVSINTLDNQLSDVQSIENKLKNSKFIEENHYVFSSNYQQNYDKNNDVLIEIYNYFIKDMRRNYISKIQVMHSYANQKRDVSFVIKDTAKEDIEIIINELFKDSVDKQLFTRMSDENNNALNLNDSQIFMKKANQNYKFFYSIANNKNISSIKQLNENILDLSNMFDSEVCGNLDISNTNDTVLFNKMVNQYLSYLNQKWEGNEIVEPKLMSATSTYKKAEETIDHYSITKKYNVTKNDDVEDIIVKVDCAIDENKDNQLHYLNISITLPLLSGVKNAPEYRKYLNDFVFVAGDFKITENENPNNKTKNITYNDRYVPMLGEYSVKNIGEAEDWVDSPVMQFKLYSYKYSSPKWETIE